jgi:hypothetical protein
MSVLGKYRNGLGVELEVTGIRYDIRVIGTIYQAVVSDRLYGAHTLVTEQGLTECGYVKMEEGK